MTPEFITSLLDFGALGLFAGFLIWLYISTQRRNEATQKKFEATLDKINANFDARVTDMRKRYGIVIADLRAETMEIRRSYVDDLGARVDELGARLERIEMVVRALETAQKIKEAAYTIRKGGEETNPDVTGELHRLATSLSLDDA